MKIFQIGFNKCATLSLYDFFKENGYKSVHWGSGKWDKIFTKNLGQNKNLCHGHDDIVFWSDINFLQRHFEVFAEQYPDAKFIYNYRPLDGWITSRKNHYNKSQLDSIFINKFNLRRNNVDLTQYWKSEWILHHNKVKEYFTGEKKNRLLHYNIMTDNGQKIVDFLPELEFKTNKLKHLHKTKK
jgi:hypothetical protein